MGLLGYRRMIIMFIFFFLCQLQISDTEFNLYYTDQSLMMNVFGHDCLYYDKDQGDSPTKMLIPFCIRPEKVKQSNDEDKLCYGNATTFKELKTNNVKTSDLFYWNAVIEIIDLYSKYLQFPNLVNDNEVYCNCSILTQLGKFCQYDIDGITRPGDFRSLFWLARFNSMNLKFENNYLTCYIGLQCQTNLFCLDWRQICNGIVDCDYGEDEPPDLCLQIESNQCHSEEEFRCQTGLCIPITMAYDETEFCPDLSDGINIFDIDLSNYLLGLCFGPSSFGCDEINRGWKQFSCLNGQSISYSDLTLKIAKHGKTCTNNHHLIYLRKLFYVENPDECWKSMICLTGFDYLYSHLNCSNQINVDQTCPNEYYFPSNSIVYSFVYFLYDKTNRIDWSHYPGPSSICYKKEFCRNYTFNLSTFSKNDLTCFTINQTNFSWNNFYEYIVHLFSPCFLSSIQINHQMFYQCNLSQSFISIYRLKDKNKDCFFNEDEDSNINLCSFNTTDLFKCFTNQNECIRELFVGDNEYHCQDGSDEYFRRFDYSCRDRNCDFRPWTKRIFPEIYRFEQLCDNSVDHHVFSVESNETDETDCEYWPYTCDSYYTRCNRIWNCPNAIDEINCPNEYIDYIRRIFRCQPGEHYCIQLINNEMKATCINMSQLGDGIIDCIGGTDERLTSICIKKYPSEFKKRFYCMNSSLCIRPDEVCNRIFDCPFHDDELICPWLFQSNSSEFYCQSSLQDPIIRCDITPLSYRYCQMGENLWFCDLELEHTFQKDPNLPKMVFEQYPPINQNIKLISFENSDPNQLLISKQRTLSLIEPNPDSFLCNFGFRIKSLILNNKAYCLCPPSYYGDYCQYQSERLTISLRPQPRYSMNQSTVFRLMIYLLNENNRILSYDQVIFNHKRLDIREIFLVYLISERMTNVSLHQQSKFVRIDSYIINETNVQYISSWFFPVSFSFLPVNRLIIDLYLVNESFQIVYCNKQCGSHGKCLHYINSKEKEYCWCDQGWFGDNCQLKSSSNLCNSTSCSPYSQCVILNEEKKQIQCLCPLGKYGDQCYITHHGCFNNLCKNNGTCLTLDERNFGYSCICHDDYNGINCEKRKRWSYVSINDNITELSTIPAVISIFGITSESFRFTQDNRVLYKNITLPIILKISPGVHDYGFVQMFHNLSRSYYYVVSIHEMLKTSFVNTSVISQNLCPNVSEIFNQTILNEYSYLKRLKLYHLPCNHNHSLRCFFDQYRMCICTRDRNSECYFYNHEHGNCNYCKNDGLCIRQDPKENSWNFICLCPKCSYGSLCQFAPKNYFITFDMLIGIEMKIGNTLFSQQSTIIHLTLIIIIIMLIFSLIFNTISIIIFSNKKVREVGCDLYLLNLTIISQIGLILLFLRFIYMIIIQMYTVNDLLFVKISCISLEYLIRLIPSLFDWLTVCISIERTYTVIKDIQFTKLIALKTLKLSRWIILIVLILNILTTLHRLFYLTLFDEPTINDEPRGHPSCVLDFGSSSWNIYEKIINICHLVLPFIFNLLSMIVFILYKTKLELTSTVRKTKDTTFFIIKEQLLKYRLLIISPTVILFLEISRFVLTFTLACIEHAGQRYVYLIGYLISFFPLTAVLFIYILPSPKYKKQLQIFVKKNFRMSLFRTV